MKYLLIQNVSCAWSSLKKTKGSKADVQSESQIQLESPSKSSSPKKIDSSNEAIETETNDCVDEHNSSRDSNVDVSGT